jgi:hypothetical protein
VLVKGTRREGRGRLGGEGGKAKEKENNKGDAFLGGFTDDL